jgi:hypothetical protein
MAHCFEHSFTEYHDNSWIGVVIHGGGGTAFAKDHPLVKYLSSQIACSHVYSLELPNHGKREKSSKWNDAHTSLENIYDTIRYKIISKRVIFIGYSVGAIFIIKLWPKLKEIIHKDSVAIFTGTGLRVGRFRKEIDQFWTEEDFKTSGRYKSMSQLHGDDWSMGIKAVYEWLSPKSLLWCNERELKIITSDFEKIFFVCGTENFEPFDLDDVLFSFDKRSAIKKVFTVPSDHWSYFSKKWVTVKATYDMILLITGILPQKNGSKL